MIRKRPQLKDNITTDQKVKVRNTIKLIQRIESGETLNLIKFTDHIEKLDQYIDYLESEKERIKYYETKEKLHKKVADDLKVEFYKLSSKFAQLTRQMYELQSANKVQSDYINDLEAKLNDKG